MDTFQTQLVIFKNYIAKTGASAAQLKLDSGGNCSILHVILQAGAFSWRLLFHCLARFIGFGYFYAI